jgi:hypothetical protein
MFLLSTSYVCFPFRPILLIYPVSIIPYIHTHTHTTHGAVLCHPRSQLHTPTTYKYEADTAAIPTLHTVRGTSHKGTSRKGTSCRGTSRKGTSHKGTSRKGTSRNGTSRKGTRHKGTSHKGTNRKGTSHKTVITACSSPGSFRPPYTNSNCMSELSRNVGMACSALFIQTCNRWQTTLINTYFNQHIAELTQTTRLLCNKNFTFCHHLFKIPYHEKW